MRLILSYTGTDLNGAVQTLALPVQADSVAQAQGIFAEQALAALTCALRDFDALGHRLLTVNFFKTMDERQRQMLQQRYPNRELILHNDAYGRVQLFKPPRIEPLDTWFERTHAEAIGRMAQSRAADTLSTEQCLA